MVKKIVVLLLLTTGALNTAHGQVFSNTDGRFEFNVGISGGVTAMGNPSQLANKLAEDESYLRSVSNMRGLPWGINGFMNLSYRLTKRQSVGMELTMGYNIDGGTAEVAIGTVVPNYVMDAVIDAGGDQNTIDLMNIVYPRLTTENTMKGQFIDPKVRFVYKVRGKRWSTQMSLGASFLIPFNYYAFPSKDPRRYKVDGIPIHDDGLPTSPSNLGNIFGKYGMWGFRPVSVPFPLRTTDGRHYMNAINPLADFAVRAGYGISYLEVNYSTNFMKIHNLKIAIGLQMQSGKGNYDNFE